MKLIKNASVRAALALCLVVALGLIGCAGTGKGAPETSNCDANISWDVAKEAKLTQFDCAVGTHGGQPALIFTVGLMNAADNPYRYRVNIFLEDMDKASGHLVPRKGSPPVVAPGKSETVKIPFIGTDKASKKILVIVKTLSAE